MNKNSLHTTGKPNKQKYNQNKNFVSRCIAVLSLSKDKLLLRRMQTLAVCIGTFIVSTLQRSVRYSAFFIVCCLLLVTIFLSGCENDEIKIRELTENKVTQEEAINIESFYSQEGKMKAKLTAPLMIRVLADTVYAEFPKTLHVDFYDDSAKIETRLDSKYGKYFETQNKVYLRDSVVVINVKGDTLKSPDLWWDQSTKLFYTDKYAIYHGVGKDIYGGKGMQATQDLKSIIFNQPTGTIERDKTGLE